METAAFPDERTVDALRQATNLSQTASPPDNHGAVLDFNPFPGLVKNRLLQAQTKTSSDPPPPPRPRPIGGALHPVAPVQPRPRWLGRY